MQRLVSESSMGPVSNYQLVDEAVEGGNGARAVEVEAGISSAQAAMLL